MCLEQSQERGQGGDSGQGQVRALSGPCALSDVEPWRF